MRAALSRVVIAGGLSWLAAAQAHAFCRTTTDTGAPHGCPDPCTSTGIPLAWSHRDLSYAFNVRGFPGIPDADLRNQLALSFGAWEEVQCGGQSVGLDIRAEQATTTLEAGPREAEPNTNVIVYYSAEEWTNYDLPDQAFALTAVWFETSTGEIVGADMQFNGGLGPYVVCPDDGCPAGTSDVRNVATHEAGHFLGMAHSDMLNASMSCSALQGELSKRNLTPDDEAGLCAIYPPGLPSVPLAGQGVSNASVMGGGGDCAATSGSSRGGVFPLLTFLAASFAFRRRRRVPLT